jgi:hypothetical protein
VLGSNNLKNNVLAVFGHEPGKLGSKMKTVSWKIGGTKRVNFSLLSQDLTDS